MLCSACGDILGSPPPPLPLHPLLSGVIQLFCLRLRSYLSPALLGGNLFCFLRASLRACFRRSTAAPAVILGRHSIPSRTDVFRVQGLGVVHNVPSCLECWPFTNIYVVCVGRTIRCDGPLLGEHPVIFASVSDFPVFILVTFDSFSIRFNKALLPPLLLLPLLLQPPPLQQPDLRLSPGLAGPVAAAETYRGLVHTVRYSGRAQRSQCG